MSIHVNVQPGISDPLAVSNAVYGDPAVPSSSFAIVKLSTGVSRVDLYLTDLSEVDRLAFEFETLARTLRDEHGWKETNV